MHNLSGLLITPVVGPGSLEAGQAFESADRQSWIEGQREQRSENTVASEQSGIPGNPCHQKCALGREANHRGQIGSRVFQQQIKRFMARADPGPSCLEAGDLRSTLCQGISKPRGNLIGSRTLFGATDDSSL